LRHLFVVSDMKERLKRPERAVWPEPPSEFLHQLADEIREDRRPASTSSGRMFKIAFALVATVALLLPLGAFADQAGDNLARREDDVMFQLVESDDDDDDSDDGDGTDDGGVGGAYDATDDDTDDAGGAYDTGDDTDTQSESGAGSDSASGAGGAGGAAGGGDSDSGGGSDDGGAVVPAPVPTAETPAPVPPAGGGDDTSDDGGVDAGGGGGGGDDSEDGDSD